MRLLFLPRLMPSLAYARPAAIALASVAENCGN